MRTTTQYLAWGHLVLILAWIFLISPFPPWASISLSIWGLMILLMLHFLIYRLQAQPWKDLRLGLNTNLGAIPVNREELRSLREHWGQYEKEHQDTLQQMSLEKEQLSSLVQSMSDGLITLDSKGHISSLNRSAQKILNLNGPSVFGESLSRLLRSNEFELLERELTLHQKSFETELKLYQGTLQERIFQIKGSLFQDPRENHYSLIVFSDVTKLRHLEAMRRDFVANVSHELKTPLTSVKGYAETLLGMDEFEGLPRRFLDKISHNADRLHQIIEDLLVLSRIEQHGLDRDQMEKKSFASVFDSLRNELNEDTEKIVSFHIEQDGKFLLHGPLIHLALFNLIDNALKYSKSDQIFVRGCIGADGIFSFEVKDKGVGIPKEHLPNIMGRFYRIDKARSRENGGTGLGLSIVKLITEAHGGVVNIESQMGQGTIFRLELPTDLNLSDTSS